MLNNPTQSKGVAGTVNSMRALLSRGIPLVAVSFRDHDSERLAAEARSAGVDVAELRIDQFSRSDTDHVLAQVERFDGLPVLATVRAAHEGGDWSGTEAARLALFRSVIPTVDAIDVELSSSEIIGDVIAHAKRHDKVVIVSYHEFRLTPELAALEAVIDEAKDLGADCVKIATMARTTDDLRTLAMLTLKAADRGLIVIAMGAFGSLSRIFFPALGSRLTYSFIGDRPAPGQLSFAETFDALRRFYPEFNQEKVLSMQILEDA